MKLIALVGILFVVLIAITFTLIKFNCSCSEKVIEECPEGQKVVFKMENPFLCGACSVSECVAITS